MPYLPDLIARKLGGTEHGTLNDADVAFHEAEYQRLRGELLAAYEALNDLLVRLRLEPVNI